MDFGLEEDCQPNFDLESDPRRLLGVHPISHCLFGIRSPAENYGMLPIADPWPSAIGLALESEDAQSA